VKIDALPTGHPAAIRRSRRAGSLPQLLLACALGAGIAPAFAQEATPPVAVPAASTVSSNDAVEVPAVTTAAARPATDNIRDKASQAASATLTALLPRLAATNALPILDRSALLAGDLSRLLASKHPALSEDASDNKVQSILKRALTLLGTPYRWGGTSPETGLDCSGLVGYVFRTALGIELPRVSREMAQMPGTVLVSKREELQQGDLVFFGRKGRVDHVGIYVGEGRFLHAPSTGKDVRVDTLMSGYWAPKFMQARRVPL
jgi:cell wall-associated NlpC family hydrolase